MNTKSRKLALLPLLLTLLLILSACDTGTPTETEQGPVVVEQPADGEVVVPEDTPIAEEEVVPVEGEEVTPVAEEEAVPVEGEAEATPVAEEEVVPVEGEEATPVAEEEAVPAETEPTQQTLTGVSGAGQDYMMLASGLLGRDVDTPADEDLGDIEDFLVDLNSGNVLFALISHGGFLGIGQDQAAIPLSALGFDEQQDDLILNVSQEQFETFPNVDVSNDWPIGLDDAWDNELSSFWSTAGFDVSFTEDVQTDLVVRASQLMGYGYGAPTAANLGTIVDYIVDLGQGRIEYVILSFTDVGLYGEDWLIVPFQAIDPSTFLLGNNIVLDENIDADVLTAAPRLQAAALGGDDFFAPGWDEAVRTYWNEQGYEFE